MSSNESSLLHWELIYKLIEKDIKRKEDVLIAVIHLVLINSGYKCIGLGNGGAVTGKEKQIENLPEKWNDTPECYSLRYLKDNKVYVLRSSHTDENMVLNLLNVTESKVNCAVFNIPSTVAELKGDSINVLLPNISDVLKVIRSQLLGLDKEVETQTYAQADSSRPYSSPQSRRPLTGPTIPSRIGPIGPDRGPEFDPFGYGRADLDPLAGGVGGRGGMLFNPPGLGIPARQPGIGIPGGLPRGSVPPGARFDPMGPPDTERRRGPPEPNPDHMPPPGYDDMFM